MIEIRLMSPNKLEVNSPDLPVSEPNVQRPATFHMNDTEAFRGTLWTYY